MNKEQAKQKAMQAVQKTWGPAYTVTGARQVDLSMDEWDNYGLADSVWFVHAKGHGEVVTFKVVVPRETCDVSVYGTGVK